MAVGVGEEKGGPDSSRSTTRTRLGLFLEFELAASLSGAGMRLRSPGKAKDNWQAAEPKF